MSRRILAGVLAALLVAIELTSPLKAVSLDWQFYSGNGIDFYDPTDICTEAATVGAVQLAGNDNTERILNFFMTKGLNLAQASGFIGNMYQESALDPARKQASGVVRVGPDYKTEPDVGFGLVQWTSRARQLGLEAHMRELGVGMTDLGGQLSYVWMEVGGMPQTDAVKAVGAPTYPGMLQALRQTSDPGTAAVIIHGPGDRGTTSSDPRYQEAMRLLAGASGYETSADSAQDVIEVRGGMAQKTYDKYKDAPALAGGTADLAALPQTGESHPGEPATLAAETTKPADSCSGTTAFGGGNLAQTVMAYAHHQYGATRTDQTPAYTEAVNRALSEGRYVGGSGGGIRGNDCGGFVTTLIFDSGFDKAYNSNAKGGNTVDQEAWLKANWQPISATDAGDRQPGDVAINGSHTYIYVGQIDGFETQIASASVAGPPRSPMAGKEGVVDANFNWYRKKAGSSS